MDNYYPDADAAYEDRYALDENNLGDYDPTDWDQLEDEYYEYEDYHDFEYE